jgi:hypothetical protein
LDTQFDVTPHVGQVLVRPGVERAHRLRGKMAQHTPVWLAGAQEAHPGRQIIQLRQQSHQVGVPTVIHGHVKRADQNQAGNGRWVHLRQWRPQEDVQHLPRIGGVQVVDDDALDLAARHLLYVDLDLDGEIFWPDRVDQRQPISRQRIHQLRRQRPEDSTGHDRAVASIDAKVVGVDCLQSVDWGQFGAGLSPVRVLPHLRQPGDEGVLADARFTGQDKEPLLSTV